jgi:sarcosine oxidase
VAKALATDPTTIDYKAIVVGLGGIGSGALYWLARRLGGGVLGIEQFELGHERGGSHDHTRIIRYSYHQPTYVELAKRAYEAWREVEDDSGETLVYEVGGLDLFPTGGLIPLTDYTESLEAAGIDFEIIDAAEITRRWPQFRKIDGVTGLYQQNGGLVAAARSTAAHQRMAREYGAEIVSGNPIESIGTVESGVEVVTAAGRYRGEQLVVAAGAWSNQILGNFDLQLPLTITQEQVSYFAARDLERFSMERFPMWIWMDEPCHYGFPVYGEAAVKVARDAGGEEVTAETRTFEANPAVLEGTKNFIEEHLPEALGPLHFNKTCLYTLTPDRDFVVDWIPGHEEILVLIGAGHAFKFASALGRIASELLLDGETKSDLSSFSLARPILYESNPAKSFRI